MPKKPCLSRGRDLSFNAAVEMLLRGAVPELEASPESELVLPSERLALMRPAERPRLAFGLAELVSGAFRVIGQGGPGHEKVLKRAGYT